MLALATITENNFSFVWVFVIGIYNKGQAGSASQVYSGHLGNLVLTPDFKLGAISTTHPKINLVDTIYVPDRRESFFSSTLAENDTTRVHTTLPSAPVLTALKTISSNWFF